MKKYTSLESTIRNLGKLTREIQHNINEELGLSYKVKPGKAPGQLPIRTPYYGTKENDKNIDGKDATRSAIRTKQKYSQTYQEESEINEGPIDFIGKVGLEVGKKGAKYVDDVASKFAISKGGLPAVKGASKAETKAVTKNSVSELPKSELVGKQEIKPSEVKNLEKKIDAPAPEVKSSEVPKTGTKTSIADKIKSTVKGALGGAALGAAAALGGISKSGSSTAHKGSREPVKTSVSKANRHRYFTKESFENIGMPKDPSPKEKGNKLYRLGQIKTKIIDEEESNAGVVKKVVKNKKNKGKTEIEIHPDLNKDVLDQ